MESIYNALNVYLESSSPLAVGVAFVAGVLTSFTPCIYPMIPIIVSYIGSRKEKSRLKNFGLSVFYVIGMAVTYSVLGGFAALSGKMFGSVQTHPLTNFIIGNIIILMGLSLLDVFTLPIPKFLSGAKQGGKKKAGFLAAFSLGLASGFIAAPCTAAVLGVLLIYVANKQNVVFGMSLLFAFSLGMGALLILIGTFTGVLTALPKSGKWMDRIKMVFGWLMILLGEYFLIQAGKYMGVF